MNESYTAGFNMAYFGDAVEKSKIKSHTDFCQGYIDGAYRRCIEEETKYEIEQDYFDDKENTY